MSMNQIAEFLKPGPRITDQNMQGDAIYCFVYDPIKWEWFRNSVPSAIVLGIGTIDGFTFHVNELGEPNIRVAYMNGGFEGIPSSHKVLPAPVGEINKASQHATMTIGWVYKVPRTDDELLHTVLGKGNRIRIVRTAVVVLNHEQPKRLLIEVPVITYWDPRHTCDNHESLVGIKESGAWIEAEEAIASMRSVGMGRLAGDKIWNHLAGISEDIEPVLVKPTLLPGMERFLDPRELRLSMYNEFEDVEVDPKHPLNNDPSGQEARKGVGQTSKAKGPNKGSKAKAATKKAKAVVHNKKTMAVRGVVVSPEGKAVMAPPPLPATRTTNLRTLAIKQSFEAAKAEREAEVARGNGGAASAGPSIEMGPPPKRQSMGMEPPAKKPKSTGGRQRAAGGRFAKKAVVEKKKGRPERNPEWKK